MGDFAIIMMEQRDLKHSKRIIFIMEGTRRL